MIERKHLLPGLAAFFSFLFFHNELINVCYSYSDIVKAVKTQDTQEIRRNDCWIAAIQMMQICGEGSPITVNVRDRPHRTPAEWPSGRLFSKTASVPRSGRLFSKTASGLPSGRLFSKTASGLPSGRLHRTTSGLPSGRLLSKTASGFPSGRLHRTGSGLFSGKFPKTDNLSPGTLHSGHCPRTASDSRLSTGSRLSPFAAMRRSDSGNRVLLVSLRDFPR